MRNECPLRSARSLPHLGSMFALRNALPWAAGWSVLLVACGSEDLGGLGQPCRSTGILGSFYCDDGLVCNTQSWLGGAVCEKPHSRAAGGLCGSDENCAENLKCINSWEGTRFVQRCHDEWPQRACSTESSEACATGEFCGYEPPADCGRADAPAVCKLRSAFCQMEYAPVCGCDGKTYGNSCWASFNGVGYEKEGSCGAEPPCGGLSGRKCPDGEYCAMQVGLCLGPDASGICVVKPECLRGTSAPVCGCDRRTYVDACAAGASGVSIAADGPCAGE